MDACLSASTCARVASFGYGVILGMRLTGDLISELTDRSGFFKVSIGARGGIQIESDRAV